MPFDPSGVLPDALSLLPENLPLPSVMESPMGGITGELPDYNIPNVTPLNLPEPMLGGQGIESPLPNLPEVLGGSSTLPEFPGTPQTSITLPESPSLLPQEASPLPSGDLPDGFRGTDLPEPPQSPLGSSRALPEVPERPIPQIRTTPQVLEWKWDTRSQ